MNSGLSINNCANLILKIIIGIAFVTDCSGQTVSTSDLGTLHGSIAKTAWSNRIVYQFLGVKYAKSPTGKRRFQAPVLEVPWEGIHLVDNYGKPCPSIRDMDKLSKKSDTDDIEDCLHMAIYSANLSSTNPVMVYIHGGSFETGSSIRHPPNYLLEKDIVLVVPQYRLGPFGFLSTDTEAIPGNVAILDIILALKWIKQYISNFGGDPSNITLFGQSAGAALISAILFAPNIPIDLFHKVILQSGSSFGSWAYDFHPVDNAMDIANHAGCDTSQTIHDVNKCLINLNPIDLLWAYGKHADNCRSKGLDLLGGSKITVNKLLPHTPMTVLKHGGPYKDIPIMAGVTKHDGTFIMSMIYEYLIKNADLSYNSFNSYHLLPIIIDFLGIRDYTGTLVGYLTDKFYSQRQMADGNFTEMTSALIDIVGVVTMKSPILTTVQMHSKNFPENAYLYSFDYEGQYSKFKKDVRDPNYPFFKGVHHSDDNLYLFPFFDYNFTLNDEDTRIARIMVDLWTSFAINGRPTSDYIDHWPPLTKFSGPYLHINQISTIGQNFLDEYSVSHKETQMNYSNSSPISTSAALKLLLLVTVSVILRLLYF